MDSFKQTTSKARRASLILIGSKIAAASPTTAGIELAFELATTRPELLASSGVMLKPLYFDCQKNARAGRYARAKFLSDPPIRTTLPGRRYRETIKLCPFADHVGAALMA